MPIYEAICKTCEKVHTYKQSIADRDKTPICCEIQTERKIITPPSAFVDIKAAG